MIKSFRNRATEAVVARRRVSGLPEDIIRRARRKLVLLNRAKALHDLRATPGNRLESLSGDRRGQYSIRINNQWRICFVWDKGDAFDVEIVDYHE